MHRISSVILLAALFLSLPQRAQSCPDSTQVAADTSARAAATLVAILGGSLQLARTFTNQTQVPLFGAGHFLQRDWLKGTAYLGAELTLLLLRDKWQDRFASSSSVLYPDVRNDSAFSLKEGLSPLSNYYKQIDDLARITLVNVCFIELYSTYQSLHEKAFGINKVHMESSIPDLMLSPFKPKYLTSPWVFIPPLLGAGITYLSTKHGQPLSSVEHISMLNADFTPGQATRVVAGFNAPRYVMVASGEEMFFRGMLLTELTERTSPTIAVVSSSVLFGLWHVPYNGWTNGLGATVVGLYLGYRYESNGYDLGETIATHFWFDWVTKMVEFLIDPKSCFFAYSIRWKF
jgi:membrane protease YdiL (CAAX protease family)